MSFFQKFNYEIFQITKKTYQHIFINFIIQKNFGKNLINQISTFVNVLDLCLHYVSKKNPFISNKSFERKISITYR